MGLFATIDRRFPLRRYRASLTNGVYEYARITENVTQYVYGFIRHSSGRISVQDNRQFISPSVILQTKRRLISYDSFDVRNDANAFFDIVIFSGIRFLVFNFRTENYPTTFDPVNHNAYVLRSDGYQFVEQLPE